MTQSELLYTLAMAGLTKTAISPRLALSALAKARQLLGRYAPGQAQAHRKLLTAPRFSSLSASEAAQFARNPKIVAQAPDFQRALHPGTPEHTEIRRDLHFALRQLRARTGTPLVREWPVALAQP